MKELGGKWTVVLPQGHRLNTNDPKGDVFQMSAYFTKICNAVAVAEIKCMFVISAFFFFFQILLLVFIFNIKL